MDNLNKNMKDVKIFVFSTYLSISSKHKDNIFNIIQLGTIGYNDRIKINLSIKLQKIYLHTLIINPLNK